MALAHQTPFERRVIAVVNYLVETKSAHKKFRHKKDLLKALHLELRNWTNYVNSIRNIPDVGSKHRHIRQYLINEFDVNPAFLDNGKEPMLLSKIAPGLEEPVTDYGAKALLKELDSKQALITELRAQIALQNELIEVLKREKNMSENTSKKGFEEKPNTIKPS